MRKIIKYIPVSFVWIAWLILTAHLIIPHDHHLTESVISCPVSDNKSDHHSGFPIHCNAFNDLTSEKARPYSVTQVIQLNTFTFISSSIVITFESQLHYIKAFYSQIHIPDSFTLELSLLRAPPSSV
jgi:hypothetical protein